MGWYQSSGSKWVVSNQQVREGTIQCQDNKAEVYDHTFRRASFSWESSLTLPKSPFWIPLMQCLITPAHATSELHVPGETPKPLARSIHSEGMTCIQKVRAAGTIDSVAAFDWEVLPGGPIPTQVTSVKRRPWSFIYMFYVYVWKTEVFGKNPIAPNLWPFVTFCDVCACRTWSQQERWPGMRSTEKDKPYEEHVDSMRSKLVNDSAPPHAFSRERVLKRTVQTYEKGAQLCLD